MVGLSRRLVHADLPSMGVSSHRKGVVEPERLISLLRHELCANRRPCLYELFYPFGKPKAPLNMSLSPLTDPRQEDILWYAKMLFVRVLNEGSAGSVVVSCFCEY
jgi:hypothetical protein